VYSDGLAAVSVFIERSRAGAIRVRTGLSSDGRDPHLYRQVANQW